MLVLFKVCTRWVCYSRYQAFTIWAHFKKYGKVTIRIWVPYYGRVMKLMKRIGMPMKTMLSRKANEGMFIKMTA